MNFWSTLFNIDEQTVYGETGATSPKILPPVNTPEFFCINPIDTIKDHAWMLNPSKYDENTPRRADLNVSCFRNFLFEMDSIPLDDQLTILNSVDIPFTSLVYSGGKSIHAILCINDLDIIPHTVMGIQEYKNIWIRIASYIDISAKRQGFNYPTNKTSFIDQSCKNPSRFSRAPDFIRNTGKKQELIRLLPRLTKVQWIDIEAKLPKISMKEIETIDRPEGEVTTEAQFFALAPKGLALSIKYVDWAGSEGMYPILFRLCLWSIDSTNVTEDCLSRIFHKYVTPVLKTHHYGEDRVDDAISKAYYYKYGRGGM